MKVVAWIAFLAYIAYFIGMVAMHVLPTGRQPLYNTVSDYGVGRFGVAARTLTAINVLGTLCLLASFLSIVGSPPLAGTGFIALAILALSRLGLVFFLTDESGTKATRIGLVHALLALISFVAAISAITTITKGIGSVPMWHGALPVLDVLATLSTPLVIVLALSLLPRARSIFGLTERLFLADVNLWLLVAAGVMALHGGSP